MNNFYVYCLRRPDQEDPFEPGKPCPFYIGKGSNGRKNDHRKQAKFLLNEPGRKSIKIKIIHKLWKRGLDFTTNILFNKLTEQEAFKYEMEIIAAYGRINNKTGCLANLSDGGEGTSGYLHLNDAKQRIGKAQAGKIMSEESKRKIGQKNKGKVKSAEVRNKISVSRKGKSAGKENPFYGRNHTEESIQRMREVKKGKIVSEETKQKISEAGKRRWENISKEEKFRILSGLNSNRVWSEDRRKKMSEVCKGNSRAKGYHHTEEAKRRIGEAARIRQQLKKERNKVDKCASQ